MLPLACALTFTACDDYDDTALWEQVNDNTSRIEALEQWQEEVNNNIAALQQLLNTNDMITSVTPVTLGGEVTGYTITFLHSDPITIYHGEKGEDGADGSTPQIGLTRQEDGNWYWTLNGSLMTDAEGNPIRANGEDGKDGEDGQDGADGDDGEDGTDGSDGKPGATGKPGTSAPTPQIKLGSSITSGTIETDNGTNDPAAWYLSVDNGKTWYRISGDKGEQGEQGDTGATGGQGQQGEPGDSFFTKAPEVDEDKGTVTFYLEGGESFTLPLYQGISISFTGIADLNQPIGIGEDGKKEIPYTVNGITDAKVTALPTADGWSAIVSDETITVTVTGDNTECDLLVTATDNAGNSVSYTLRLTPPYTVDGQGNYTVYTADGLKKMAELVNGGETDINITLANDITLTEVWTPIGNSSNQYTGTFDGGNHTIKGLTLNGGDRIGLFGQVGDYGTVKNLKLTGVNISGNNNVGAVAGWNNGTISGCSVSGNIQGNQYVGGVMGFTDGESNIIGCSVEGMVTGASLYVGGIAGHLTYGDKIEECHSSAIVEGSDIVGGIVGHLNGGLIIACSATGEVKATIASDKANAGGVVGEMSRSFVTACYSTGNVIAQYAINVGGVVGYSETSTITSCYHATGDVTGTGDAIGGVLGAEGSPTSTGEFGVVNCCWSGTVSTDKGVGVTQAEIVVIVDKVDNLVTTWTGGAITTLNNPLTHAGWRYIENTGADKETRPLVLEKTN